MRRRKCVLICNMYCFSSDVGKTWVVSKCAKKYPQFICKASLGLEEEAYVLTHAKLVKLPLYVHAAFPHVGNMRLV
jgi:hypothetical protein